MTATHTPQSTEHLIQICRERSARGVATRADWERLAEIKPDRARIELREFLRENPPREEINPYESKKSWKHSGAVIGFLFGVVFMSAWWLFGDYLNREVVDSGKQWDLVTLSQYVAASLLPVFAWLGWRFDKKREDTAETVETESVNLSQASWNELLDQFDKTRKAGGTRMY